MSDLNEDKSVDTAEAKLTQQNTNISLECTGKFFEWYGEKTNFHCKTKARKMPYGHLQGEVTAFE